MSTQTKSFVDNTDAISEVLGEILLTAIAVLAFSVIAIFIFSSVDPHKPVHADIQGWVDVSSDTIYLRHAGGETIDVDKTRILIDINEKRWELTPSELVGLKGSTVWNLGETIPIKTFERWSESINEDDYVGVIMLDTGSNLVIKSGALLGEAPDSSSSSGNGTNGTTPTTLVLSAQNPATPYQSNTSQTVTFSATSSQWSINEFLLNGQHLAWSNGTNPTYTNTSASEGTYTLTLIARNTTNSSINASLIWTWTVVNGTSPTTLVLSEQNPAASYESNISQSVTFSATSSQWSYNEFLLNGQHLAWSNGTSPMYTNTSASLGTYNLTLIARSTTDPSLTDSMTWTWTVVPTGTYADRIELTDGGIGGTIKDGGYISFTNDVSPSYVIINEERHNLNSGDFVKLVIDGDQTSGYLEMDGGSLLTVRSFDFNATLYINGELIGIGLIDDIDTNSISNFESTLRYELPSYYSQMHLAVNGVEIIGWWPYNDSAINVSNINYTSGTTQLSFSPTRTYLVCSGYYELSSPNDFDDSDSSIVSLWSFNNRNANDDVGDNDGTVEGNGDIFPPDGVIGRYFNADDSRYITIPDDDTLDLTTEGSVEAWVYVNSFNNLAGIVHKGNNWGDESYSLQFGGNGYGSTNRILFSLNNGENYLSSGTTLSTGAWYHVVGTWDSTSMDIYINGAQDAEKSSSTVADNSAGSLQIGSQWADGSYQFDGRLDQVALYNYALNASEVQQQYSLGI